MLLRAVIHVRIYHCINSLEMISLTQWSTLLRSSVWLFLKIVVRLVPTTHVWEKFAVRRLLTLTSHFRAACLLKSLFAKLILEVGIDENLSLRVDIVLVVRVSLTR